MPLKISKAFPRRKSSGNVLSEVPANQAPETAEPSFKVFPRPQSGHKSLDLNFAVHRSLPARRNSFEQEDDDMFTVLRTDANNRGSGGTENSLSTAPYDSAASSTRLSSASTVPSSADARSDSNVHSIGQTTHAESQPPAVPVHQQKSSGFLKTAGRTFSFGMKSKPPETSEPPVPPLPAPKNRFSVSTNRDRAPKISDVNTAATPQLLQSDLALPSAGLEGFENMFDAIGARSREPSPSRSTPAGYPLHSETTYAGSSGLYNSANIDRSAHVESSPYSWTSDNSRDALMQTPNSVDTVIHNSPQLTSGRAFGRPINHASVLQTVDSGADENMFEETPSRPRAYSRPNRQTPAPPSAFPTPKRQNTSRSNTTVSSIQHSSIMEREDAVFDPSLIASAALASRYQETRSVPVPTTTSNKKVMTPAQFERYKEQQDERRRMNKIFKNTRPESDESDDNYDDADEEDEAERDRQVANQRRKQEAHLAVYRQTMMKVTGEGPTPAPRSSAGIGNQTSASQSATELANQFSVINLDKSPDRNSEDDEDEDIPLGILAAHGFPNKNRPPTRLASSSSIPNIRASTQQPQQSQQPGPGSSAGDVSKRGSLPVFARHLPEDPYYGAGLVNQSNRESMAIHPSTNYAPSGAATAHPHHPSGLVGVIAGEERARAMRRGSPNGYDMPPNMQGHPGMARAQTTGSMPNMMMPPGMMPPMPGMLSPGDHAQIQMSQQMTQMMQMQMQWMQQMQQMMSSQGQNANMPQMGPMPPMSPYLQQMPPHPQTAASMSRPQSVPLQGQTGQEQRTMSLLRPPSMGVWNQGGQRPQSSYATSIAPSERSNVGLASRYRPVSVMQEPEQSWNKRASTMTSSTFRPLSQFGVLKQPQPSIRKVTATADDEDDEAGWAEMKAKKDQKKKVWKLRKGQNVLQELYN